MNAQFEFTIEPCDYNPNVHPYDEEQGVVATAFKRQFPEIKLQRARGDYYLGIGRKQSYHRYEFRIEDQEKIQKLYNLTFSNPTFEKFTVVAKRK